MPIHMTCQFIPPYLLERLAASEVEPAETLLIDAGIRSARLEGLPPAATLVADAAWTVHTANNGSALPGTPVRSYGDPESGDAAVDEAAYGISGSLALFEEVYQRRSYDGAGAPVSLTVHYERNYDNAYWDGQQLVFGDGDGKVFERFTKPVDVLGHEFAHAVTEHAAGLRYRGQSGALNESVSDVFASCLKQRLLGQTAAEADWLIGEGIFRPGVTARGLRDMAAPGTAYDDPRIGKDPQVGDMADYVDTMADNGGVHLNSGIPNRAFHLAALAIGGHIWEGAGRIWYDALIGDAVGADTDFAGFASATIDAAGAHSSLVRDAWSAVGVTGSSPVPSTSSGGAPTSKVEVRRTGGFAGLTTAGSVDLLGDDPRVSEVRSLVERIDLRSLRPEPTKPDMFVYDFDVCGDCARVAEHQLTPELSTLARIVLQAGSTLR